MGLKRVYRQPARKHVVLSSVFVILLLLGSLNACKKDSAHTFVGGTVQDFHNGIAISGARVYLASKRAGCANCQTILTSDSTTTDSKGSFAFDFIPAEDKAYSVVASANSYYSDLASGGVPFATGKISNIIVPLTPYTYLRIHAVNTNPFDWNDRIILNEIMGGSVIFYGPNTDTTFTQLAYAATINTFHYTVIKRNRSVSYSGQVYCNPYDITSIQVNY
jgi:hypothetical protein